MYTTKLNKTTKKAQGFIDSYYNANCSSVMSFYGRCSFTKLDIEKSIKDDMYKIGGHGYRITGGNSSFFSCAFLSGDDSILYYYTHSNIFEIEL